MMKKTLASAFALVVISAISGTGAQAATSAATAGGICTKAGAVATIAGKSYTCTKVLSGKLVWTLTTLGVAKPQITGAPGGDGGPGDGGPGDGGFRDGGPGDDHSKNFAALQATMKKYNACLVAHGGTAMAGPGGFRGPRPSSGTRPTTPPVQPSLNSTQSKAVAACASLAPKFGFPGDH